VAGCVDTGGLGTRMADASAGGMVGQGGTSTGKGGTAGSKGTGGMAGSTGSGGSTGTLGAGGVAGTTGSGGAAGTLGAGGVAGSGGAPATGGQAGIAGTGGTSGTTGGSGAGGTSGTGGKTTAGGAGGAGGAAGSSGGSGGTGGKGSGGSNDAAVDAGKPDAEDRADGAKKDAPKADAAVVSDTPAPADGVIIICGPVCDIYCPYGNVLDDKGCPTCKCNPGPTICPAIKCTACPYGYLVDANGCQTCDCAPAPNLPCSQLLDLASCAGNSACTWLEPGCGTPALAAAGCYESATIGCTSDESCTDGRTCLKRVIDPCARSTCNACGQTISLCL